MTEGLINLDSEDIRYIHDEQIRLYGGIYGENEPNLIEYMVDKPFLELYGEVLYPTLYDKAAVYLDGFAKNQYFSDGNKRTGINCSLVFLAINGYQLTATDKELFKYTVDVAESSDPTNDMVEIEIVEIAEWFEKNTIRNLTYF